MAYITRQRFYIFITGKQLRYIIILDLSVRLQFSHTLNLKTDTIHVYRMAGKNFRFPTNCTWRRAHFPLTNHIADIFPAQLEQHTVYLLCCHVRTGRREVGRSVDRSDYYTLFSGRL